MDWAAKAAKTACFLLLACLLGASAWTAAVTGQAVEEVRATAISVRRVADLAHGYVAEQAARLRDPRNQKSLEAGIQAAAVWNATGRLVNTQTIPRINRTLDELEGSAAALRRLVEATDKQVNAGLLPEATRAVEGMTSTVRRLDGSIKTAEVTLQAAATATQTAGDDIHRLLSDPALQGAAKAVEQAAARSAETAAHVEEAAREMPKIAVSLEAIAATSSRFRVWVLLSQIASAIGRAFF